MSHIQKKILIYESPLLSESGYGCHAREILKIFSLFDDFLDMHLVVTDWGSTNRLSSTYSDTIVKYINKPRPSSEDKIDYYVQLALPSEFKRIGQHNIGITAATESTLFSQELILGFNRMDAIVVPSNFTNHNTVVNTGHKDVITIPQTCNLNKAKNISDDVLHTISEDFCFLYNGTYGKHNYSDRKNVKKLIECFLLAFNGTQNPPALVLKTHETNFSTSDYKSTLGKIQKIKEENKSDIIPNIYLIHGSLTDEELNGLYNNKKIKCLLTTSRGESFGRPLLESILNKKPVIAPKYGGYLDFLTEESFLVGGKTQKHSHINNLFIEGGEWFEVDPIKYKNKILDVYTNIQQYNQKALVLRERILTKFPNTEVEKKYKKLFK